METEFKQYFISLIRPGNLLLIRSEHVFRNTPASVKHSNSRRNIVMKSIVLAALVGVIASVSAVQAETISGKVMNDHPGVTGGSTSNPTARPDNDGSGIQRKAMQEHPGTKGGTTATPRAKPDTNSIQGAIMEQHPGVN